jgi:environmental stress-induced protein Ves
MRHRVLGPADHRRVRWKNGKGFTTEIAQHPPGAGLEAFIWRASIAGIAQSGPFSQFPGVARSLVLLAGEGMRLDSAAGPLDLRAPFDVARFDGADGIWCTLAGGPVRAFNLMLRRSRAQGSVTIVRGCDEAIPPSSFTVCHASVGASECLLPGGHSIAVEEGCALVVESSDPPDAEVGAIRVHPVSGRSVAIVASIATASTGQAHVSRPAISPSPSA